MTNSKLATEFATTAERETDANKLSTLAVVTQAQLHEGPHCFMLQCEPLPLPPEPTKPHCLTFAVKALSDIIVTVAVLTAAWRSFLHQLYTSDCIAVASELTGLHHQRPCRGSAVSRKGCPNYCRSVLAGPQAGEWERDTCPGKDKQSGLGLQTLHSVCGEHKHGQEVKEHSGLFAEMKRCRLVHADQNDGMRSGRCLATHPGCRQRSGSCRCRCWWRCCCLC